MAGTFQATIGGKFTPLINLRDDHIEIDNMIITFTIAVTDTTSKILGKKCRRKKPWVTRDVLDLCDARRDLKERRYEEEGAKEYRKS